MKRPLSQAAGLSLAVEAARCINTLTVVFALFLSTAKAGGHVFTQAPLQRHMKHIPQKMTFLHPWTDQRLHIHAHSLSHTRTHAHTLTTLGAPW